MPRLVPISCDASEDEFFSALRKYKSWSYIENDVEREQATARWRKSARDRKSRGAPRTLRMRKVFQTAHDKVIREGWQLDDALTYALDACGVKYPGEKDPDGYERDEKTWRRRVRQSFKSVPQHRHRLLDDDVEYGLEHALDALVSDLPHVVAAIFITSDSNKRCRIIREIFRSTRQS
jgi:hypothetical protein